jgi:hypothetical protein
MRPFWARSITTCTIKDLHALDISGHEWSLSQAQRAMVMLQEIPYKQHHAVDKGRRI